MGKKGKKRSGAWKWLLSGGVVIAIGAAVYYGRRASGLQNVYYEPQGIRIPKGGITATGIDAVTKWAVSNPSDVPLKIQDWFAQFFYNGVKIGESRWKSRQDAPPRQTSLFEIPVRINYLGLGQTLVALFLKAMSGEKIKLDNVVMKGKTTVNGVDADFEYTVALTNE